MAEDPGTGQERWTGDGIQFSSNFNSRQTWFVAANLANRKPNVGLGSSILQLRAGPQGGESVPNTEAVREELGETHII